MKNVASILRSVNERGYNAVYKHNSIFTLLSEYGNSNKLALDAISGLSSKVGRSVELFKNSILPAANIIEKEIKENASTKVITVIERTKFVVHNYNNAVDVLTATGLADLNSTASISNLPVNPLVVELGVDDVHELLVGTPNREFNATVREIARTKPPHHVAKLYQDIFGGLSSTNVRLNNMIADPVSNIDDIIMLYSMTLNYIQTLGVANQSIMVAKTQYLNKLIQTLNASINLYATKYNFYRSANILIMGIKRDDALFEIDVIGETYSKYLEENTVNAIFGYALSTEGSGNVGMDAIVSETDRYIGVYDASMRRDSLKAELNNTVATRIAYTVVFAKYLNELTDQQLFDITGIADRSVLIKAINAYIDRSTPAVLNDITNTVRSIVGTVIFDRPDFSEFVANMRYYNELDTSLSPEEVATAATTAMIVTYLLRQINFNKAP